MFEVIKLSLQDLHLQLSLQDFDMVEDADGKIDTEGFEAELEEMLQNQ
jgi:hypothetical protein